MAEHYLRRIESHRDLNIFLWADADRILAGMPRDGWEAKPLAGLPLGLKDNIDTAGIPTTAGSVVDQRRVPSEDAAVWARLRDSGGATLLGKVHLAEFAFRVHNSEFGRVRNPRNPDRATGGSSSGSAAAVAAGLAPAALGTDTGGSVRIPAAYCGVVGYKPSHGLIDTAGIVPLSVTLDNVGVLAGSVADAGLVLEQMTTSPLRLLEPTSLKVRLPSPAKLRIGLLQGYFRARSEFGVDRVIEGAAKAFARAGCRVIPITIPEAGRWRSAHRVVMLHEAWRFHARRLREGAPYGPVFRSAIAAGEQLGGARYLRALATQQKAIRRMAEQFAEVDVLLLATCPGVAPLEEEGRTNMNYTRNTTLAAFAGLPAISVPAGIGRLGLPVGAQLVGAQGSDARLLGAAALLEALVSPSVPARPRSHGVAIRRES